MPALYGIDGSRRLVHLVTIGDAPFDEWRDALLAVFSDPSSRMGLAFISDRRGAASSSSGWLPSPGAA